MQAFANPMDPGGLIERLKNGDQSAYSYLYDTYAPALYGLILRILKSKELSEHVLEETFLKVAENVPNVENCTSLFSWMCNTARIASRDFIDSGVEINAQPSESTGIVLGANSRTCADLLDGMDLACREFFDYIYLQGHSLNETCDKFQLPVSRGRVLLRLAFEYLAARTSTDSRIIGKDAAA